MVAIIVLSGSSATKMMPKVMARTEKLMGRPGSGRRSGQRRLQACQRSRRLNTGSGAVSARHARRRRHVDLEALEGLIDGALADGQGMGARRTP